MQKARKLVPFLLQNSIVRGSAVVFTGTMAANVLAYIYHVVVARILGLEKYGELATLLSIFYLLNVPSLVFQTVLTKYFSVFKARHDLGQAKQLFLVATKWIGVSGAAGLLFTLLLAPFFSGQLKIQEPTYFIWLYVIFVTFFFTVVSLSALQGFQMFVPYNILTNVGALLRLVFGFVFAFFGVGWVLIGNIVSNILSYFFYFIPLRFVMAQKSKIPLTLKGKVVSYGVPAFLTILGTTALFSQDVILVKHFFSPHEAGVYSALSVLGKIIFYASSAVGLVIFPVVAERTELKQDHRRLIFWGLSVVGGISLVITLVYFVFPSIILRFFLGTAFLDASKYLGLFGLFISFFATANLLFNSMLAQGKTRVWIISLGAAILQAAFLLVLHTSLTQVIWINTTVSGTLLFVLLLYYGYVTRFS